MWVFGFAHQVPRNPLGIIRSMTESMMLTRVSRSAQRESFAAILQAVDGLARRLGEFIDFSKPVTSLPASDEFAGGCSKCPVDDPGSRPSRTMWKSIPALMTRRRSLMHGSDPAPDGAAASLHERAGEAMSQGRVADRRGPAGFGRCGGTYCGHGQWDQCPAHA